MEREERGRKGREDGAKEKGGRSDKRRVWQADKEEHQGKTGDLRDVVWVGVEVDRDGGVSEWVGGSWKKERKMHKR